MNDCPNPGECCWAYDGPCPRLRDKPEPVAQKVTSIKTGVRYPLGFAFCLDEPSPLHQAVLDASEVPTERGGDPGR